MDNYEFKMESIENIEYQRIKKEREAAADKDKKTPAKNIEIEIPKVIVPLRIGLENIAENLNLFKVVFIY